MRCGVKTGKSLIDSHDLLGRPGGADRHFDPCVFRSLIKTPQHLARKVEARPENQRRFPHQNNIETLLLGQFGDNLERKVTKLGLGFLKGDVDGLAAILYLFFGSA